MERFERAIIPLPSSARSKSLTEIKSNEKSTWSNSSLRDVSAGESVWNTGQGRMGDRADLVGKDVAASETVNGEQPGSSNHIIKGIVDDVSGNANGTSNGNTGIPSHIARSSHASTNLISSSQIKTKQLDSLEQLILPDPRPQINQETHKDVGSSGNNIDGKPNTGTISKSSSSPAEKVAQVKSQVVKATSNKSEFKIPSLPSRFKSTPQSIVKDNTSSLAKVNDHESASKGEKESDEDCISSTEKSKILKDKGKGRMDEPGVELGDDDSNVDGGFGGSDGILEGMENAEFESGGDDLEDKRAAKRLKSVTMRSLRVQKAQANILVPGSIIRVTSIVRSYDNKHTPPKMLLQLGDRLEVLELVGASTMSVYKVVKVVGKKVYRKMIYEREEGAMPFAFKLNQRVTSRRGAPEISPLVAECAKSVELYNSHRSKVSEDPATFTIVKGEAVVNVAVLGPDAAARDDRWEDGLLEGMTSQLHQPLSPVLKSGLSDLQVLRIFASAKVALQNLHSSGFVHRDLKPDNLVLEIVRDDKDGTETTTDRVLIIDMGSAVAIGSREMTWKYKEGFAATGTVPFMSLSIVFSRISDMFERCFQMNPKLKETWGASVMLFRGNLAPHRTLEVLTEVDYWSLGASLIQTLDAAYFNRTFIRPEYLDHIASLFPDSGPVGSYGEASKAIAMLWRSFSPVTDFQSYLKSDKPLINSGSQQRGEIDGQIFGPILKLLMSRSATMSASRMARDPKLESRELETLFEESLSAAQKQILPAIDIRKDQRFGSILSPNVETGSAKGDDSEPIEEGRPSTSFEVRKVQSEGQLDNGTSSSAPALGQGSIQSQGLLGAGKNGVSLGTSPFSKIKKKKKIASQDCPSRFDGTAVVLERPPISNSLTGWARTQWKCPLPGCKKKGSMYYSHSSLIDIKTHWSECAFFQGYNKEKIVPVTVFDASGQVEQFWDGRGDGLGADAAETAGASTEA